MRRCAYAILTLALATPALAEPPGPAPPAQVARMLAAIGEAGPQRPVGLMTDRPMYRPGETIWFRAWGVPATDDGRVIARLVDGQGRAVVEARVATAPFTAGHLDLPAGLGAGHYTLRLPFNGPAERPIIVEDTTPPPLRLTLRYARTSHRPGDPVVAALEVRRPDGSPVAGAPVAGVAALDGASITVDGLTDAAGRVALRFPLPAARVTEARLNLRVDDGGAVAALTRPIPLAASHPWVRLLPEGGDAVVGLPGRIYVMATGSGGRPARFSGRVLDDAGAEVARVESAIDGRARFELTPAAGRRYRLVLDGGGEAGLPTPRAAGCALAAVDDFTETRPTIGLDLRCSKPRAVVAVSARDGAVIDARTVEAGPEMATRVELADDGRRGPVTVTLLAPDGEPLAERVVFRHRDRALRVAVTADRERAAPGETVALTITAADPDGRPVEADLALAVLDEGPLLHADDQSPDLPAQLLLAPVVRGHLERAGRYLEAGAEAGAALDLLMGTAGHRRFVWLWPAFADDGDRDGIPDRFDACPEQPEVRDGQRDEDGCPDGRIPQGPPRGLPAPRAVSGVRVPPGHAEPPSGPRRVLINADRIEVRESVYFRAGTARIRAESLPLLDAVAEVLQAHPYIRHVEVAGHTDSAGPAAGNRRLSRRRAEAVRRALIERGVEPRRLSAVGYGERRPIVLEHDPDSRARNRRVEFTIREIDRGWTRPQAARQFPDPPPPTPARDDFREVLAWVPRVTLVDGRGAVKVRLSDAATGFRAIVQGTGGGAVGRGQATVVTRRPLAAALDAPRRALAGDRMMAPLTIGNHTAEPLSPTVRWTSPLGSGARDLPPLAPGARTTVTIELAAERPGPGPLRVEVEAGPWKDALAVELPVAGRGYPHTRYTAGALEPGGAVEIPAALPAPVTHAGARLVLTGSTFGSLLAAAERLVVEPTGCFEQTSARHWPNVMALRLFERTARPVDPALIDRTRGFVAEGARRLAGFEVPGGGFSMYGRAPASPALTAFAIVQMSETKADSALMARAAEWLAAHRAPERQGAHGDAEAAWIDWALALAGRPLAPARITAPPDSDPYVLAVRTLALAAAGEAGRAGALADALLAAQGADGRWLHARSSITRSYGSGLVVEATALAVRALAALDRAPEARRRALAALYADRRGGAWISTQATAQALAAILTAPLEDGDATAGEVAVRVGGREIWRRPQAGMGVEPHTVGVPDDLLGAPIALRQTGGVRVNWSLEVTWTAETVPPGAAPVLRLSTALDSPRLALGQAGTLTATVEARETAEDPLVRIGLPAGLAPDRDQLRGWVEAGRVALAEVHPGEVVLYLDRLDPGRPAAFPLTVTARHRGRFRGPASSAYPYYAPDAAWAAPLPVTIE